MTRALIVGHTGQDGRLLWDQLAARGFSLVGIARQVVRVEGADWREVILINDGAAVWRLLNEFQPQQIYFLAAHHHSSEQPVDDEGLWSSSWRVHVDAFAEFLRCASRMKEPPRIFYASSSRVFGTAQVSPQDESTPFRPACVYGLTKVAAMHVADFFRREKGVFVSCGILFNHESALRGRQFVSQRVVDGLVAIKRGKADRLTVGSLDARVDWGYAGDYTRAMQAMLDAAAPDDFVVASGMTHSVRDLVDQAAAVLGLPSDIIVEETARLLKRESQELCGNPAKLMRTTGWKPSVDFPGLVRMLVEGALEREPSEPR